MKAKKVETCEPVADPNHGNTYMNTVFSDRWDKLASGTGTDKPKRRNGRLAWKPKALQAERMASMYYWMGLVLSVIMFILGINVGLYAF